MAQLDTDGQLAPELDVATWFNTPTALQLSQLRGRVVVLYAFQMLCPGCILHGLPQAQRIHNLFARNEVQMIGLHTVFEHHEAMRDVSLKAFMHEFRVTFPVAVDRHRDGMSLPSTMARYEMRGTPTLILIDRAGRLRAHHFGQADDMAVGAQIARLVAEPAPA
jgi:peroxiredoxin